MTTLSKLEAKNDAIPEAEFSLGWATKSPASEKELAALEKKPEVKIPPALRELLSKWGTLRVDAKPEVWPRMRRSTWARPGVSGTGPPC